jgi:molybdate transport system regulatory protein
LSALETNEPTAVADLRLRLVFGGGAMIGPGKADLLELIAQTGSISAACRAMNMSYKRAWMLVETMNAMFRAPVVQSARGGAKGGGATLTTTGEEVLRHYRALERRCADQGAPEIAAIIALLGDMSGEK